MKCFILSLLLAGVAAFAPTQPIVTTRRAAVRSTGPVMGENIRELRDRISSVKNTQKITSAMRLVAAAKVRRAQEAVIRSRPFSENLERVLGGLLQRLKTENLELPLLEERPVDKVLLVSLSGDRGLCGSYNSYVIKKTTERIAELKEQGIAVELVTVGRKAGSWFGKRDTPVRKSYEMGQSPTAEEATAIAQEMLSWFMSGDVDRVELIYTKFNSMISSTPTVRTMLPLSPTGIETEGDEIFKLVSDGSNFDVDREEVGRAEPAQFSSDMIFEQAPEQIVNAILPLYFNGQVLKSLQESVASELAARMTAMQSASDNAKALAKDLSVRMNRARQAKVTQELMEIVAGADAT